MAVYRNTGDKAVDVYSEIDKATGKLRYSIGKIKPDTTVEAVPHSDSRYLVLTSGGYAYANQLELVSSLPPPPPSGNKSFTLFVDGYKPFTGELEKYD